MFVDVPLSLRAEYYSVIPGVAASLQGVGSCGIQSDFDVSRMYGACLTLLVA
jgi:hypothetical protein